MDEDDDNLKPKGPPPPWIEEFRKDIREALAKAKRANHAHPNPEMFDPPEGRSVFDGGPITLRRCSCGGRSGKEGAVWLVDLLDLLGHRIERAGTVGPAVKRADNTQGVVGARAFRIKRESRWPLKHHHARSPALRMVAGVQVPAGNAARSRRFSEHPPPSTKPSPRGPHSGCCPRRSWGSSCSVGGPRATGRARPTCIPGPHQRSVSLPPAPPFR